MPYEARQEGEDWEVVNTETGKVVATHKPPDAKGKAERQLHLLRELQDHEGWDEE